MSIDNIIESIRGGKIDVNNQQNIFSTIIKGLILNLNKDISVRDIPVPHMILHTGDDTLFLENKNKDYSGTSNDVTNENYIYNIIPRCHITPGGIDFITDQLTSPYTLGNLHMEYDNNIYSLVGEFRRIPFKFSCELKYYLDSYTDALELIQQIATKLTFLKVFKIVYLGQVITCSYKIPESYQGEHMTDLDGMTQDNRSKTITLSLEIESNLPVFENRTIMNPSKVISGSNTNANENGHGLLLYGKDGIKNNEPYEAVKWNIKTGDSK